MNGCEDCGDEVAGADHRCEPTERELTPIARALKELFSDESLTLDADQRQALMRILRRKATGG